MSTYVPPLIDHTRAPVWARWVSLGIDVASPWATDRDAALWDDARWDSPTAQWAGSQPSWASVLCDVTAVKMSRGRAGSLDRVPTSTLSVKVENDSGWASWSDNPDPSISLGLRPGRAVRLTAELTDTGASYDLWTGWLQSAMEDYPSHGEGPPTADLMAVDSLSRLALVDPIEVDPPIGAGEQVHKRLERLCTLASWPLNRTRFEPSPVTVVATPLARNLLDEAQLTIDSEGGIIYGDRDGFISSRSRDWLRTEPVATEVQARFSNNPDTEDAWCPVGFVVDGPDVSTVANRVIVNRETDPTPPPQQFDDGNSQSLYGIRTWKRLDYLCTTDNQVELLGSRRLLIMAQPARRLQSLTIDPLSNPTALFPFVLAVDYGWRLFVEYQHPSGAWGWSGEVHVHGIEHAISHDRWITTLRVEDAAPWVSGAGWDRDLWDQGKWSGTVPESFAVAGAKQGSFQRWH
jgi:hypothetical protein